MIIGTSNLIMILVFFFLFLFFFLIFGANFDKWQVAIFLNFQYLIMHSHLGLSIYERIGGILNADWIHLKRSCLSITNLWTNGEQSHDGVPCCANTSFTRVWRSVLMLLAKTWVNKTKCARDSHAFKRQVDQGRYSRSQINHKWEPLPYEATVAWSYIIINSACHHCLCRFHS